MIGLVIIFIFNSVNSTMAPAGASKNETDKIAAVTTNATWRDIGAAAGTLTGGLLLSDTWLFPLFIIITFIMFGLLLLNYRKLNLS